MENSQAVALHENWNEIKKPTSANCGQMWGTVARRTEMWATRPVHDFKFVDKP